MPASRQAMSVDWIRFTPAAAIDFQAAATEPLRSMPRQASSITETVSSAARASTADQLTQKSVASPQT